MVTLLNFKKPHTRALVPISEEKHEPVSDIDTAAADSLKALDLKRPIREADMGGSGLLPCNVAPDSISWLQILAVLVAAAPGCRRTGSTSAKHTKSAKGVRGGPPGSPNFRDPSRDVTG